MDLSVDPGGWFELCLPFDFCSYESSYVLQAGWIGFDRGQLAQVAADRNSDQPDFCIDVPRLRMVVNVQIGSVQLSRKDSMLPGVLIAALLFGGGRPAPVQTTAALFPGDALARGVRACFGCTEREGIDLRMHGVGFAYLRWMGSFRRPVPTAPPLYRISYSVILY